ncbi:probable transporter Mch2p [[Candida] anglica]|uniref:Probable transporter Mch2p n=1 Tax=[Candida] anglica TaxID=148631 RepID=A0ABP0E824_9ASCO
MGSLRSRDIEPSISPSFEIQPAIYDADHDRKISRHNSHTSGLSKIISEIKDDQDLHSNDYRDISRVQEELSKRQTRNVEEYVNGSIAEISSRRKSNYNLQDSKDLSSDIELNVEEDQGPPKDSGFAWVVAICSMFSLFCTWGATAGYGVFLSYYISANTFHGATEYDYALIGGLVVCLAQIFAPLVVLAYKMFGPRYIFFFGIVLQTVGYMLASISTKIWQLYLTQGFMVGTSYSCIFIPTTMILPTWFDKKKATGMGIAVSGSGLGGLFFSLVMNKIISVTGDHKWALRTSGFVVLMILSIVCTFMKPRVYKPLPYKTTMTMEFIYTNTKVILDIRVFKKSNTLIILAVWYGFVLFGYMILVFSMSAYASSVGLTPSQGSILTALLNAGQVLGRPIFGSIADRYGRVNFSIVNCIVITILIFTYWINATSFAALCPFVIFAGMTMGIGNLMCQPMATDILDDMEDLPAAWSGLNIVGALFCLAPETIALTMNKKGSAHPFRNSQVFAGCCFLFGLFLLLFVREFMVRKRLRARLALARSELNEIQFKEKYYTNEYELYEARIQRYEYLLANNPKAYLIRICYPIRT